MSSFEMPRSSVDVERLLSERQWVQRLARSLVADPNQADDVAQESWLTALRHPPRHDANLKSWLSELVRNTAAALRRKDARRSTREREAVKERVTVGSSAALERAEVVRELVEAVLALDPTRREALVLVYFEGLAPHVAAERVGVPHSTFRTHVRRGLAEVREKLERKRGRESWLPALTVLACRPDVPVVGVLLMNTKLLVTAAAAVLIALGLWTWSRSQGEQVVANTASAAHTPLSPSAESEDHVSPLVVTSSRAERTGVTTRESPRTSTLLVSAIWASTSTPARDVQVAIGWKDSSGNFQRRQARTNVEGRAQFDDLRSASVAVSIDRGFDDGTALVPGEITKFEARISTDVHVRGRVVGPGDKPVFGAAIFLSESSRGAFEDPVCTTDGDGRFDLGEISRRRAIHARHDGLGASFGTMPHESASGTIDVLLRMQGIGCELNGTVVSEAGDPIRDAEVVAASRLNAPASTSAVESWTGTPGQRVRTDGQGNFRIRGLVECPYTVRVQARGFAAREQVVTPVSTMPTSVRVSLIPGLDVHGVVRDTSGAWVPGAVVVLIEPHAQITSDVQGAFRFSDVSPGTRRFQVRTKTAGMAFGTIDFPRVSDFEWNPVVDRGRVIEGRVVDEQDRPLSNWWVRSQVIRDTFDSMEDFELLLQTENATLRTDVEGRFTFTNCTKYPPRLTVYEDEGGRSGALRLTVEDVQPGTKDLVLRVPEERVETNVVSGQLVDEQGTPVGEARVVLWHTENKTPKLALNTVSATGSGTFSLVGVEASDYKLSVRASGYCEHIQWLTVTVGSVALDPIVLMRGGSLVARLSTEDAALVRAGKVDLTVKGTTTRELAVFGDEARLDEIVPGEWTLYSERSSGRVLAGPSVDFQIKAGETTRIDFDLKHLREPK